MSAGEGRRNRGEAANCWAKAGQRPGAGERYVLVQAMAISAVRGPL
jgi:hypothetical protein